MSDATDSVSRLLDGITDLPSIPAIALEIVRLTEDENCTLDQFSAALSRDPALSGKVLRFANSSLYNLSTPASTLQHATMILGTRAVKLMSLSFSLADSLPSDSPGAFDIREYWKRSVLCAVAARSLAERHAKPLTEEAFLCGLLSRIGQLVLGYCRPEVYAQLGNGPGRPWPLPSQEREILGCDGYEIGAALLRTWSLPAFLCDAVASAGGTTALPADASEEARMLARIVHSASLCEELICVEPDRTPVARLLTEIHEACGMEAEQFEEFLVDLEPAVSETARMLEVEIDPLHTAEVRAAAQRLLLNEGLGFASEARQVREHATRLEVRNRVLSDRARSDSLTGLQNRSAFDEVLARLAADGVPADSEPCLGLLLLDVDHFKSFNDQYGHQTGDEVLRMIGRAIRDAAREDEVSARYGGEEFAAILPRVSKASLAAVAERLRVAVEMATLEVEGTTLSVTVSIGGALAVEAGGGDPVAALIEAADRRLYEAKNAGRNRCRTAVDQPS